ncbi:MAG: excisionase family DNA-binding protein [Pseudomonadota bacterium]
MSTIIPAADNSAVPFSERRCLSVEQAASYIGLGRTSVFNLIRDGELQTIKVGQRRLVVRASADRFIEKQIAEAV